MMIAITLYMFSAVHHQRLLWTFIRNKCPEPQGQVGLSMIRGIR